MKPTTLLIPALGLFASHAISAPLTERSNADIHRGENQPATFPDVSKRDVDGTLDGVITGVDGTLDGVVTGVDGTLKGVATSVDGTLKGVVSDVDGAIGSAESSLSKR